MRQRRNTQSAPGRSRQLLCGAILTLLAACQPSGPGAPLATYLTKLRAAASTATPAPQPTLYTQPLAATSLQLDIPSGNLERLDFLDLSGCALKAHILKRNSSLGRLAKPSQRLLLELEYLQLAPPCITHLRDHHKDALADTLATAWQQQRESLPALIFNATLGSDEYRAFWLVSPAPGEYPRVSQAVAVAALAAINNHTRRWLSGDYDAQNPDFELLLSEVAGGDGAALLHALSRQGEWLTPIDALEAQLAAALPQRYYNWMIDRTKRLTLLASAPGRHLEQPRPLQ